MTPKVVNPYAAWRFECCKADIEAESAAKSHSTGRKRKWTDAERKANKTAYDRKRKEKRKSK